MSLAESDGKRVKRDGEKCFIISSYKQPSPASTDQRKLSASALEYQKLLGPMMDIEFRTKLVDV